jgi:hypothetical protein
VSSSTLTVTQKQGSRAERMDDSHSEPRAVELEERFPRCPAMTDTEITVAKIEAHSEARTNLERLGTALQVRGWRVSLTGEGPGAKLTVTNPAAPSLSETIVCGLEGDGWHFMWEWLEAIEPVDKIDAAARRIRHVLREVM